MPRLRLFSWNVNGIRACERKGFLAWMQTSAPRCSAPTTLA
jgi:exonuclease III